MAGFMPAIFILIMARMFFKNVAQLFQKLHNSRYLLLSHKI